MQGLRGHWQLGQHNCSTILLHGCANTPYQTHIPSVSLSLHPVTPNQNVADSQAIISNQPAKLRRKAQPACVQGSLLNLIGLLGGHWRPRWQLTPRDCFTEPSRNLHGIGVSFLREGRCPNETKVLCSWSGYKLTPLLTQHLFCFTDSFTKPSRTFTDAGKSKHNLPLHAYLHRTFTDLHGHMLLKNS